MEYLQHITKTKPKPFNIVRLIFGATLIVRSEIAVKEHTEVVYSAATNTVEGGLIDKIMKLWHRR